MKEYTETTRGYGKSYYKDKAKRILHREDGPAIEYENGNKVWYLNGACHRIDGPAFERIDGYKAWYINNEPIFGIDESGNVTNGMK